MMPGLTFGTVMSQAPDGYGVLVQLEGPFGGAGPTIPVQVATHGPRDGVTGRFPALPSQGTGGVIAFPRGDYRNGVWLGSVSRNALDASTAGAGQGGVDYEANHGGGWNYTDQNGGKTTFFPDNSVIQIGATMPSPTRHTLNAQQARVATPFTPAERNPNPPSAFPINISLASGISIAGTTAGALTVTVPSDAKIVLTNGIVSITLSGVGATIDNGIVSLKLTGSTITAASDGGPAQPVKLADDSDSTIFMAQ